MSWSIGEARSLATKAARGAGLPWGLAEEAGFTAEWLEIRNIAGLEALALYLHKILLSGTYSTRHCPIATGANISDTGSWEQVPTIQIRQPLLLVPFLGVTAGSASVLFCCENGEARVNMASIDLLKPFELNDCEVKDCEISKAPPNIPDSECRNRISDTKQKWIGELGKLAALTYAPATEESRLSGAGAGTNDND